MEVIATLAPILGTILMLMLIPVGAAIYFVPTIIAKKRQQKDFMSIFLLNLFLGWLLVGWVVSLVWAVKKA